MVEAVTQAFRAQAWFAGWFRLPGPVSAWGLVQILVWARALVQASVLVWGQVLQLLLQVVEPGLFWLRRVHVSVLPQPAE